MEDLGKGEVGQVELLADFDGDPIEGCDGHGAPLDDDGIAGFKCWHDLDCGLTGFESIVLVVNQTALLLLGLQCHEPQINQQSTCKSQGEETRVSVSKVWLP